MCKDQNKIVLSEVGESDLNIRATDTEGGHTNKSIPESHTYLKASLFI